MRLFHPHQTRMDMQPNRKLCLLVLLTIFSLHAISAEKHAEGAVPSEHGLAQAFRNPPSEARPWVYWFWIDGNVSKKAITAELESFQESGIGGLVWIEVGGKHWSPKGEATPLSPKWRDAMKWAMKECQRLGLQISPSYGFGYGSGGSHITAEFSMQTLIWSERNVEGGREIVVRLNEPKKKSRYGFYRDVAVMAWRLPESKEAQSYRIFDIDLKRGRANRSVNTGKKRKEKARPMPNGAAISTSDVIDLTSRMDKNGMLTWNAPAGNWVVTRYGHGSNGKNARPLPPAVGGLAADTMSKAGMEAHFDGFLRKIIGDSASAAGKTLSHVWVDSIEIGFQDWTATFPHDFKRLRGYDLGPWLPVLTGRVVGSQELSRRFLWDVRVTQSELMVSNYAGRLRELAQEHGIKLAMEPYGLNNDNFAFGGVADLPMSEFWTSSGFKIAGRFPRIIDYANKPMSSVGHTYGRPVIGAEAFTTLSRWEDHPGIVKAVGDAAFCGGINRLMLHYSGHQPYDNCVPGLRHRMCPNVYNRNNTWWDYSRPWTAYLSRCQYMLQQGRFVADFCYWVGEGSPIRVRMSNPQFPAGYDYDMCSTEILMKMTMKDGSLVLPSGMKYRYLLLPKAERITLPVLKKIQELVDNGAKVIGSVRPTGSPSLTDYPQCDAKVQKIAADLWGNKRIISDKTINDVFVRDMLKPDFESDSGLLHIHRRIGEADVYFISNQTRETLEAACKFRVTGKLPELWNPETGLIAKLPQYSNKDGRTVVPLHFGPAGSKFVVFRESSKGIVRPNEKNYVVPRPLRNIEGSWQLSFDPKWGGPLKPVQFNGLTDWRKRPESGIKYYSGTVIYRKQLNLSEKEIPKHGGRLLLDLGEVEVVSRVRVNGRDCGIAWKVPYRVDITKAVQEGKNELEIEVANLWINRMIGDEQLPEDCEWESRRKLRKWPKWVKTGAKRPSGRFTFTSYKWFNKKSPLVPSGLLGPVRMFVQE